MKTKNLTDSELSAMGISNIEVPEFIKEKMYNLQKALGEKPSIDADVTYLHNISQSFDRKLTHVTTYGVGIIFDGVLIVAIEHRFGNDIRYEFVLPQDEYTHIKFDAEGKPNKIGVFTKNKLMDWVNYLVCRRNTKKAIALQYKEKINRFLTQLKVFEDSIVWNRNGAGGYIEKNGIVLEFNTDMDTGHIYTKLRLSHSLDTHNIVDTSILLSENLIEN